MSSLDRVRAAQTAAGDCIEAQHIDILQTCLGTKGTKNECSETISKGRHKQMCLCLMLISDAGLARFLLCQLFAVHCSDDWVVHCSVFFRPPTR